MATRKDEATGSGAAERKPGKMDVEKEITNIKMVLRRVVSVVEKFTNQDLDNDRRIGRVLWPVLGLVGIGMLFASFVFAAEKIVVRYVAPEGDDATIELAADEEDDAADEAQITMGADGVFDISLGGTDEINLSASGLTVGGTIAGTPVGGTVGTGVTATVTASETYGTVNKTVLTLADVPIVVTDLTGSTNSCGGTQIYDWPEGEIYVLGFMVDNFTFKTNSVIDDGHGGDFAFGTAVGAGPDLTTTEINMTDAKVSIDPIQTAVDAVTELDDIGESRFDGTATAIDLYVNVLIDGGDIDADTTNNVAATVTIHWINLGDD